MSFSPEYFEKRLAHERKELSSGKFFLWSAAILVVLNSGLVAYNLWRGWRMEDFLYAFILVVWTGCFVVQRKILARKKERVDRLEAASAG